MYACYISWLAIFDKCFPPILQQNPFYCAVVSYLTICATLAALYSISHWRARTRLNMIQLLLILSSVEYLSSNNNCIIDEQKADERPSFCNNNTNNSNTLLTPETMRKSENTRHFCCIFSDGYKEIVMHFSSEWHANRSPFLANATQEKEEE